MGKSARPGNKSRKGSLEKIKKKKEIEIKREPLLRQMLIGKVKVQLEREASLVCG